MFEAPPGIAVVGVAAQLPGGNSLDRDLDYASFFDFLMRRGEAYSKIPKTRFNTQYLRGISVGQIAVDVGAFLTDIEQLDFMEFGITPKDAQSMPLSTRKLVELSFLSLLDSGINYRGKNVGCYMAGVAYDTFTISGPDDTEVQNSFAYAYSMLANRVSYHLDLRGPSVPLDTACSSTMYATHLAVQALRSGECEAAVVGGSQLNHRFSDWLAYSQGGVLAQDGKCKPFDASTDGFSRGEGVVVIVLKPLQAAVRDHDHIYATILGTGVNSSGSLVPANAPSAQAQKDAMQRAFLQTGRNPKDVDFIELHATGTVKGDPTEANWVGEAFQRDGDIVVGSVKGNLGHLEITAFLASLCKVCGIFNARQIPPNVNLKTLNPAIEWSKYRLRVPLEPEPLGCRSGNGRPLIAMTSSGIGGANGHAVLEAPPPVKPMEVFWRSTDIPVLLVAAGLSPQSVSAVGDSWLTSATSPSDMAALARIAGRRARSLTWRSFAVTGSSKAPTFGKPALIPKAPPATVFVFSGQGTQYFDRSCFALACRFVRAFWSSTKSTQSVVSTSLVKSTGLFGDSPEHLTDALGDPWPIAVTLPALTMLQLALVDALAVAGVRPDAVVGHSAGETAVLSASGAAPKTVALRLAIARGRALSLLEDAKGTMAAVSCSPKQAQMILEEVKADLGEGILEIGCYNTAEAITLSGQETHVELAVAKATAAGIFARKLKTRIPVHSAMMELCRAEFVHLLSDIFPAEGAECCMSKIPTYSTVTGGLFDDPFDAQYYWDGTLKPVLFRDAIEAMLQRYKGATFVEIGPHPVLTGYLRSMAEGVDDITVTCPLRRPRTPTPGIEVSEFLTALGSVVVAGHNCVDFDALYGSAGRFTGTLPKYPFAPKSVPWFVQTSEIVRQRQHRNGPLNYPQLRVNAKTHPELADHVVKGEPIMPASGFIEMALEFGATDLHDVKFHRMLPLSSNHPTPIQVELFETQWSIRSASTADVTSWPIQYNRLHASGFLSMEPTAENDVPKVDVESIRASMKPVRASDFYSAVEHVLQYGPLYQWIQECHIANRTDGTVEALVKIRGRNEDIVNIADYIVHPAILDAALHFVAHPMVTGNYDRNIYHLPNTLAAFRTYSRLRRGAFPETLYAKARTISWSPDAITFDIIVCDDSGSLLCVLEQLEVARHGFARGTVNKRYDVVYEPTDLLLPTHPEGLVPLSELPPTVVSDGVSGSTLSTMNCLSSSTPSSSKSDSATHATEVLSDAGHDHASLILHYVRGDEMSLQHSLSSLDPLEHASILFVAQEGVDGDAALGFTRSLRREHLAWIVRVAVFDATVAKSQQLWWSDFLATLPATHLEMRVGTDGAVCVPRITLSSAPSDEVPFDPSLPWVVRDGKLVHSYVPVALQHRRVAQVSAVHPHRSPVRAFMATLQNSSRVVVGITSSELCSHLEIHESSVVDVDSDFLDSEALGPSILAPAIAALALGPPIFSDSSRHHGMRALIFECSDEELHQKVQGVLRRLGIDVSHVDSLSDSAVKPFYALKPHVIISGTRNTREMALLRTLLPPSGRVFFWNDPDGGLSRTLVEDPWVVGDAVRAALQHSRQQHGRQVHYLPLLDSLRGLMAVETARPPSLFDPRKAYLLIGGVGSLGLYIALWMYENGARHIVLTSRSGPDGLKKRGDFIALRILQYLQVREDLVLCTPSADATSREQLQAVLEDVSAPLGGAFMLTWLLNDRMFASHTQESFDRVFPSKLDVLETLSQVVDIPSLDFCIAFSSVAALFGNQGQTNYAAANTALSGMSRKYRNAFSMICPIILDSGVLTLNDDLYKSRVRRAASYGMTGRELCNYLGDMGPSQLYDYLVLHDDSSLTDTDSDEKMSLVQIVCNVLDLQEADISPNVPLTSYGLDSLSASALSFALRPLLSVSQLQLLADLTILDLQARMDNSADDATGTLVQSAEDRDRYIDSRIRDMQRLLQELSATMAARGIPDGVPRQRESLVALVTGTTGSLGSHILAELLANPGYDKVIALVRPGQNGHSAKERQLAAFEARGLDATLLDSPKLVLVDCPFEGKRLGIDPAAYEEITRSVSHIIHVAWPLSFALPLPFFKSALFALREMLDLATEALLYGPVSMLFGSTSGIFRSYTSNVLPMEQPLDAAIAVGQGYSESKWIAEQLIQVASERTSLQTTIVRIGQLAGGRSGVWNSSEWLPVMISVSAVLRCLPDGQGPVSWLPVHVAASAIIEMVGAASSHSIVHLRHPRPVTWSDIMGHFSTILGLPMIDYATWMSQVPTLRERPGAYDAKFVQAAVSLSEIFPSGASTLDVSVAENDSQSVLMALGESSMRISVLRDPGLKQLDVDDVRKWVEYWRRTGSLPSS
ncbi:polyketide synthase [Cerioporus squamosus]|nr:polyketide synthase [Cerioporus squamosus]